MIIELFSWWYGSGLRGVWQRIGGRTAGMLELFSVGLLARTLFAPFRQIDAGRVNGSFDVQLRAWFDRSFSRVFGFFLRSFTIIVGCIAAVFAAIFGVVWAVLWLCVPFLPLVGLVLMLAGVEV